MRILITGASGGIGGAAALRALEDGHEVYAHGRDASRLAGLAERGAEVITGDLATEEGLSALSSRFDRAPLDAVIAAQGVPGGGAIDSFTDAELRRVLEVNYRSVVRLFRALRTGALQAGSRYVVVASQASLRSEPYDAVYCSSKWAALAWAEAQRKIEGDSGVRIRSLCPGRTVTPLFDDAMASFAAARGLSLEDFTADTLELIPLRRFASATETAESALFLASPDPRPAVLAQTGGEVPW